MPCAECASEGKIGVIVVDVQGDFTTLKKGSLAVAGTDQAFVDNVCKTTEALGKEGLLIFGTQDWHPADHVSFFTNHDGKKPFEAIQIEGRTQVLWPPHCVQGTENARVMVDNNLFIAIVKKGQDSRYDSYSGFQDDGGARTEMDKILKRNMVKKVVVYGIATDYCVKATAIDAARAGFKVLVVEDLCRGVAPETSQKALEEMKAEGIAILKTMDLKKVREF
ncbi:MAG: bifunctional nicotinamidase/pyrazinamidase [Deltaproteobacteria bacterium]|nr:bifunctional nicotinamidase/pyrazinamidase [Deltaproteobacteria bacterium]